MKINRKVYDFQEIHPNQKVLCVCERDTPLIAKIRTYDFGDATKFNSDITSAKCESNLEIEHHIKLILLHFYSCRSRKINFSTIKLCYNEFSFTEFV